MSWVLLAWEVPTLELCLKGTLAIEAKNASASLDLMFTQVRTERVEAQTEADFCAFGASVVFCGNAERP